MSLESIIIIQGARIKYHVPESYTSSCIHSKHVLFNAKKHVDKIDFLHNPDVRKVKGCHFLKSTYVCNAGDKMMFQSGTMNRNKASPYTICLTAGWETGAGLQLD